MAFARLSLRRFVVLLPLRNANSAHLHLQMQFRQKVRVCKIAQLAKCKRKSCKIETKKEKKREIVKLAASLFTCARLFLTFAAFDAPSNEAFVSHLQRVAWRRVEALLSARHSITFCVHFITFGAKSKTETATATETQTQTENE